MPLHEGSSDEVIGKNISEMMESWKSTGKIGNTHPKNAEDARRIATAAAYANARRGKKNS